jgi:glucose-1-phosphate cytidylyltransferase
MKVVILAGGFGTRLSEETENKPKPMVEIGGRPILWHIMKHYAHFGFKEFLIALGYKGEIIKHYFLDYHILNNSVTINLATGSISSHTKETDEDWTIHLVDTGLNTNTGGRIKRLERWLKDEPFMLTYGDGVSSVDLSKLVAFHHTQNTIVTVTAVRPPARFGGLSFEGDRITTFTEKPHIGEGWINGGFMVVEPEIFSCLSSDDDSFEHNALEGIAAIGKLSAYRHEGFWQCMDTLRDMRLLDSLWQLDNPPWKLWE